MRPTSHYIRYERVDVVEATDRGLLAHLHGERLRIDFVRADVVRFKISRGGVFDEHPTFAVATDPLAEPVEIAFTEDADGAARLRTSDLVVTLWREPFRLDVHRTDGSAVVEAAADPDGRYWTYATLNDAFVVRRRARREDAVFGLGEKTGPGNRRGRSFTLWNNDVLDPNSQAVIAAQFPPGDPRGDSESTAFDPYYMSIPFFQHLSGEAAAGSFVDNGHRAEYDFEAPDTYAFHFLGGQYTEYVFAGPGLPRILEAYTWLTGRTAPPPLWALGFHQCRWFDYRQDEVEALGARLRDAEVPCDVLWLDIDYMSGFRVFTWDETKFPDVPGMLARLRERGYRVVTIVDPGVKHDPGYWVFDQAVARDVLCRTEGGDIYIGQVWPGNTAFPDFVTPEGRAWWGELNAGHVSSGLAGIWNDMNEPATGDIDPLPMRFDRGRASHERYHNQYAMLMAMGTTEGLRTAMPDLRTFVLSRAGFAGIQRYAANWLGDNCARWDHLWLSIPMGTGLGLSGQPFVGADVGGFRGHTTAELLLRWTQYAVFSPFFRNHNEKGYVDQYPWAFGPAVLEGVREAIRLRYRLLPYVYAAFLRAGETGEPVQRAMVFDHQEDGVTRDLDDQFLFGRDLLVAPVLAPGTTARQVYLPAGGWYDWATGDYEEGGRFVVAATPMDRIPLYARAGAVIPMWRRAPSSTADHHPREVELHLFVPREDGEWSGFLQEDDGLTFAAADGARYRTELAVARTAGRVTVRGDVLGDGYPDFAREEFHLVLHGATPDRVTVGDEDRPVTDGRVVLRNAGEPFRVSFDA